MLATSSSFNWFMGGMTESYSLPFTVSLPLRPRKLFYFLKYPAEILADN